MLVTSNVVKGRCPVCGAAQCTCGGPTEVVPVDQRMELVAQKGPLRVWELGRGVGVQLTDEEARRRGLLPKPKPDDDRPRHKMRRPPADEGR